MLKDFEIVDDKIKINGKFKSVIQLKKELFYEIIFIIFLIFILIFWGIYSFICTFILIIILIFEFVISMITIKAIKRLSSIDK